MHKYLILSFFCTQTYERAIFHAERAGVFEIIGDKLLWYRTIGDNSRVCAPLSSLLVDLPDHQNPDS